MLHHKMAKDQANATEKLTLDEVVDLLPPATSRGVQLERPQEVGGALEVGSNREDL